MSILESVANAFVHGQMKKVKPYVRVENINELQTGIFNELVLQGRVSSDGTPAKTYFWKSGTNDLMISFSGGGAAFDEDSCNYPLNFSGFFLKKTTLYLPNVSEVYDFATFLPKDTGIISPYPFNPFCGWNKVIIPYSTGDFHVGTRDMSYVDKKGNTKTMHFHGYTNFLSIMELAKKAFPSPERILITGSSAGSFGASALADKIIDMYPDCKNITVYCDSSYLYNTDWDKVVRNTWKAPLEIADRVHTEDLGGDWLLSLYKTYGGRIKLLYGCSTEDYILSVFTRYMKTREYRAEQKDFDLTRKGFKDRIARLAAEGVDIHYFVNELTAGKVGGTMHCISQGDIWHEHKVDGKSSAQWVADAIEGNLYDVGLDLL